MKDSKIDLSVILPCYEEGENLRILLPQLHSYLSQLNISYEIMVIDSLVPRDITSQICIENNTTYINQRGKPGFGPAIRTGIEESNGVYTLFMDADGSHNPNAIIELWNLHNDYDVVIASRYVEKGHSHSNPIMLFMSRILNFTYKLILKISAKDISTNFKLYRTQQLKSLNLVCDHFDIIEEIFFKLTANNPSFKFKEISVSSQQRMHGKSKRSYPLFIFSHIKTLILLRFDLQRGQQR